MVGDPLRDALVPSEFARQLETELAAALHLREELQSALQWAKEELAAVNAERDALKSASDRAQEDWSETARLYKEMKVERDALIRGEYVCKKCGIRKDGEGAKGDF
jgi:hypothetical protein